MPLPPKGFYKGKGKGNLHGAVSTREAHELKSCDIGTLRYRADIPLNERNGAPMVIAPIAEILYHGTI